MALTELHAGSKALVLNEEWSLPRALAYAIGSPQVTDGVFQAFIDLNGMAAGNEVQIRIYEKVQAADTQRIVFEDYLVGPQAAPIWVSPSLLLMNGWDVTIKSTVGTPTITWSIRQVA